MSDPGEADGNPINARQHGHNSPHSTNGTGQAAPSILNQNGQESLSGLLGYSGGKIKIVWQEEKEHAEELLSHVRKLW